MKKMKEMKKIVNYLFSEQQTRDVLGDAMDASICTSVVCVIIFILQGKIDIPKLIFVAMNAFVIVGSYKSIKKIIIPNIKSNKRILKNIFYGVAEMFMSIYLIVNAIKSFLIY